MSVMYEIPHHTTMFQLVEDPVEETLRLVNYVLITSLVLLSLYIVLSPFYAEISYRWYQWTHTAAEQQQKPNFADESPPQSTVSQYLQKLRFEVPEPDRPSDPPRPVMDLPNKIIIPKIGVDGTVLDGLSPKVLNRGFWHRPHTSAPDLGGNTVISGHRFLYTFGPSTLYHLDKVAKGDRIYLRWQNKIYTYEVAKITIVAPTAIEVEAPTDTAQLTLYTCHPLWTSRDRLVVVAKLITP